MPPNYFLFYYEKLKTVEGVIRRMPQGSVVSGFESAILS